MEGWTNKLQSELLPLTITLPTTFTFYMATLLPGLKIDSVFLVLPLYWGISRLPSIYLFGGGWFYCDSLLLCPDSCKMAPNRKKSYIVLLVAY